MARSGSLIWFRSDLRVADHSALLASDPHAPRHACFLATPEQWREHDWGKPKVGFLRRNVQALAAQLQQLGIKLHIRTIPSFAEVPDALAELCQQTNCQQLLFNEEPEVNEQARDEQVRARCAADGVEVQSFIDQTVLDVVRLRTGSGGFYTVFTPFKKRWLQFCQDEGWSQPRGLPETQSGKVTPDPVPHWEDEFEGVDRDDLWTAGEDAAQERLQQFASQRIGHYDTHRDLPAVNGTSTLSPYLALGVLSPRQCLHAAVQRNDGRLSEGQQGADVWITELIWREFYRHVLLGYPHVCRNQPFKRKTRGVKWRTDEADFAAWCEGRTGVPFVDAGMRQLNQTGWMHNRVRMVVAMFLTKNLLIDWRWGERYFMQRLVDGDLASNNGGWQWSASTGTDAAPYFRIFNPFAQGAKFDAEWSYIRRFVPELESASAKFLGDPLKHAGLRPSEYPAPIFDYKASRERALQAFKSLDG